MSDDCHSLSAEVVYADIRGELGGESGMKRFPSTIGTFEDLVLLSQEKVVFFDCTGFYWASLSVVVVEKQEQAVSPQQKRPSIDHACSGQWRIQVRSTESINERVGDVRLVERPNNWLRRDKVR